MRNLTNLLSMAAVVAMLSVSAHAANTFNNAGGDNDYISNADNWSEGLPVLDGGPNPGPNPGTITVDAGVDTNVTHEGYNVTHSAGEVSRSNGLSGLRLGTGTIWLAEGSASYGGVRGLVVSGGATYTQQTGVDGNFSNNNRDVSVYDAGSAITINGGTFTSGRSIVAKGGGTLTLNDGTIAYTSTGVFGGAGFSGGNGMINLNGGSVTADRFGFQSGTVVKLGGSSVGTATFADWGSGNGTNSDDRQRDQAIHIDLLSGTQVSLTLASTARALDFNDGNGPVSDPWAEALWNTDRLRFNGNTSSDLGGLSWADATNPSIGLDFGGTGEYFVFTGAGSFGGTLALQATAIPEPASLAMGLVGLTLLAGRRRRQ
jgi:MYXO-CTERM domain-containing protein